MTYLDPRRSPCRAHPCSVEHADVVRGFREHAESWERQAEVETGGYAYETVAYAQSNPRPLFRDWLVRNKREAV